MVKCKVSRHMVPSLQRCWSERYSRILCDRSVRSDVGGLVGTEGRQRVRHRETYRGRILEGRVAKLSRGRRSKREGGDGGDVVSLTVHLRKNKPNGERFSYLYLTDDVQSGTPKSVLVKEGSSSDVRVTPSVRKFLHRLVFLG